VTTMPNIANGQVAFHFFQNTTKLDLAASRWKSTLVWVLGTKALQLVDYNPTEM
jgi:hypothetical protein